MANSITYLGKTYNDDEIVSGNISKKQSLNMAELSVDTAEITLRPYLHLGFFTHEPYPFFTHDGYRFETSEANPLAGQFQQNTPLVQYVDGSQTAIWFLQSIERLGTNIYKLNGFSSLGRLTQITHYGGIYDGTQTVADVVAEIMGDLPYYISSEFQNIALYGWLPIATARDNLQQVLFAINASLQTDAQGVLRIQNLLTATQATIAKSEIFQSGASVKYNTPVTKVVVIEHQYAVGSGSKELFNGTTTGNQLIAFDEPMSNLQASGLSIISSGANFAVVSGTGTLTGTPYIHTMREVERAVDTTATVENIVRVENATLVGITASGDVVRRLADYYAYRNVIIIAVAKAFLSCGSVVNAFDPYDEIMRSTCIESEQVTLSHTPKSTITAVVGYMPWQTIPFEDAREVLIGSGTWTVPEGVSSLEVILIGAGDGGYPGEKGEDAKPFVQKTHSSTDSSGTRNHKYAAPSAYPSFGHGGAAGVGGQGGKILRLSLSVSAGQSFAYSGGVGGEGAPFGGTPGAGTATTFGAYSSALGSTPENGYTDPVTGDLYAAQGPAGIAGGDGKGFLAGAFWIDQQLNDPPPIVVDGVAYTIGAQGSDVEQTWRESMGGLGGGAAYKTNGNNGQDGRIRSLTAYCVPGGNGATALPPPSPSTQIGYGGRGGNGGGGAGSAYGCYHTALNSTPSDIGIDPPAIGGDGSAGQNGGPGGVIMYYRRPAV